MVNRKLESMDGLCDWCDKNKHRRGNIRGVFVCEVDMTQSPAVRVAMA